jgi:GT2 family glycosyltransferase
MSFEFAKMQPLVYVVVPVYNRRDRTLRFLKQIRQQSYKNFRVIIVDDASTDGTADAVHFNYPDVDVIHGNGDLWWSGGTNEGVRLALARNADYVITINDDAKFDADLIAGLIAVGLKDPRRIVGARIERQDHPGVIWSLGTSHVIRQGCIFRLNFGHRQWLFVRSYVGSELPVDTMPGNGVLIPATVFRECGLYDAEQMPQYHADSEFVYRAKQKGFNPVIATNVVIRNEIRTEPLVHNVHDLVYSKRSDFYWPAIFKTVRQALPPLLWPIAMAEIYSPWLPSITLRTLTAIVREVRKKFYRGFAFDPTLVDVLPAVRSCIAFWGYDKNRESGAAELHEGVSGIWLGCSLTGGLKLAFFSRGRRRIKLAFTIHQLGPSICPKGTEQIHMDIGGIDVAAQRLDVGQVEMAGVLEPGLNRLIIWIEGDDSGFRYNGDSRATAVYLRNIVLIDEGKI